MPPYSTVAQRGYIIGLYNDGKNAVVIADRPEITVSVHTVRRWIDRYRKGGFDDLNTRRKSGRRRATTAAQDEVIAREVLATPMTPAVSTVNNALPEVRASKRTIYRM